MSEVDELREKLAAIEHERWADWQKWLHSKLYLANDAPDYTIDKADIDRWQRQIDTPYSELSDKEKASDMEQVDRYWPLIEALIKVKQQEAVLNAITEIWMTKSEGLFDGPDLFVKRKPIEDAVIKLVGYEAYKAMTEAATAASLKGDKNAPAE